MAVCGASHRVKNLHRRSSLKLVDTRGIIRAYRIILISTVYCKSYNGRDKTLENASEALDGDPTSIVLGHFIAHDHVA